MTSALNVVAALIIFMIQNKNANGERILAIAAPARSHVHYIATVAEDLLASGHEVHTILSSNMASFSGMFNSSVKIYHHVVPHEEMDLSDERLYSKFKAILQASIEYGVGPITMFRFAAFDFSSTCHNLLGDKELFKTLIEQKFDLALIDGFPLTRCTYVLPYNLGIPYVSLVTQYEPWLYGIPAVPSVVPFALNFEYTEKMTFFQRLRNFLTYGEWFTMPLLYTMSGSYTTTYAPGKPYKSPNQLAAESKIWFLNTDNSIDYARPLVPHVIEVGGLTTKEPKALPEDLQTFMDDSTGGVILISFGSLAKELPDSVLKAVAGAVKQFQLRVIWKCHVCNRSESVHTMPWFPQNDLLAHENTKLFITHGGNNGQFEALYNAVPMLVIPLFSDQMYNGKRIEYKGYGISLDTASIDSNKIVKTAHRIIHDESYKNNILIGSKIFKSRRESPKQRVVSWIEHILEFGGEHLISQSLNMPWYQLWMVDIFIFVVSVSVLSIYVSVQAMKYFHRNHLSNKSVEKQNGCLFNNFGAMGKITPKLN